ncbi:hypothetical protein J7T55_005666 [Diaporthe amygdali]|uniref:uncharacterized protein n=1 Tax=Phomopsis amygdali TaxID=1214568 RepID=UPI0022FEEA21|nr:uncharacterized protein J7T55_005666 [Diaporthe amygdali]KAJ0124328.1 hypothetical protein J7T55_005666 [Diaporthe amygdali]
MLCDFNHSVDQINLILVSKDVHFQHRHPRSSRAKLPVTTQDTPWVLYDIGCCQQSYNAALLYYLCAKILSIGGLENLLLRAKAQLPVSQHEISTAMVPSFASACRKTGDSRQTVVSSWHLGSGRIVRIIKTKSCVGATWPMYFIGS